MAAHGNPNIVTDGLVLCLDAANKNSYPGSGTTWTDLSGEGNHGTLTSGPTFSSDKGGCIVFDGSNDYVAISGYDLSWNNTNSVSIEVGLEPPNITQAAGYIGKGPGVSKFEWFLAQRTDDVRHVYWDSGGEHSNQMAPYISGQFAANTPVILGMVWSHTANESRFYKNGELDDDSDNPQTSAGASSNKNRTDGINIGGAIYVGGFGDSTYWEGKIFFVRIYNVALSANDIKQNFEAHRIRFGV